MKLKNISAGNSSQLTIKHCLNKIAIMSDLFYIMLSHGVRVKERNSKNIKNKNLCCVKLPDDALHKLCKTSHSTSHNITNANILHLRENGQMSF